MDPASSLRASTSPTASKDSRISFWSGTLELEIVESVVDEEDVDGENGTESVNNNSGTRERLFPKDVFKSIEVPSGSSYEVVVDEAAEGVAGDIGESGVDGDSVNGTRSPLL